MSSTIAVQNVEKITFSKKHYKDVTRTFIAAPDNINSLENYTDYYSVKVENGKLVENISPNDVNNATKLFSNGTYSVISGEPCSTSTLTIPRQSFYYNIKQLSTTSLGRSSEINSSNTIETGNVFIAYQESKTSSINKIDSGCLGDDKNEITVPNDIIIRYAATNHTIYEIASFASGEYISIPSGTKFVFFILNNALYLLINNDIANNFNITNIYLKTGSSSDINLSRLEKEEISVTVNNATTSSTVTYSATLKDSADSETSTNSNIWRSSSSSTFTSIPAFTSIQFHDSSTNKTIQGYNRTVITDN